MASVCMCSPPICGLVLEFPFIEPIGSIVSVLFEVVKGVRRVFMNEINIGNAGLRMQSLQVRPLRLGR